MALIDKNGNLVYASSDMNWDNYDPGSQSKQRDGWIEPRNHSNVLENDSYDMFSDPEFQAHCRYDESDQTDDVEFETEGEYQLQEVDDEHYSHLDVYVDCDEAFYLSPRTHRNSKKNHLCKRGERQQHRHQRRMLGKQRKKRNSRRSLRCEVCPNDLFVTLACKEIDNCWRAVSRALAWLQDEEGILILVPLC